MEETKEKHLKLLDEFVAFGVQTPSFQTFNQLHSGFIKISGTDAHKNISLLKELYDKDSVITRTGTFDVQGEFLFIKDRIGFYEAELKKEEELKKEAEREEARKSQEQLKTVNQVFVSGDNKGNVSAGQVGHQESFSRDKIIQPVTKENKPTIISIIQKWWWLVIIPIAIGLTLLFIEHKYFVKP